MRRRTAGIAGAVVLLAVPNTGTSVAPGSVPGVDTHRQQHLLTESHGQ